MTAVAFDRLPLDIKHQIGRKLQKQPLLNLMLTQKSIYSDLETLLYECITLEQVKKRILKPELVKGLKLRMEELTKYENPSSILQRFPNIKRIMMTMKISNEASVMLRLSCAWKKQKQDPQDINNAKAEFLDKITHLEIENVQSLDKLQDFITPKLQFIRIKDYAFRLDDATDKAFLEQIGRRDINLRITLEMPNELISSELKSYELSKYAVLIECLQLNCENMLHSVAIDLPYHNLPRLNTFKIVNCGNLLLDFKDTWVLNTRSIELFRVTGLGELSGSYVFNNLVRLSFVECKFPSARITDWLAMFPNIKELQVINSQFNHQADCLALTKLDYLSVSCNLLNSFLDARHIDYLQLNVVSEFCKDLETLKEYLIRAVERFQRLKYLRINDWFIDYSFGDEIAELLEQHKVKLVRVSNNDFDLIDVGLFQ